MMKHIKKPWTKDELELLNLMARQGNPNRGIAAAMGRSVGSIVHKRSELHITETELGTVKKKQPAPDFVRKAIVLPTVNASKKDLDDAYMRLREALNRIDVLTAQNTELQHKLHEALYWLNETQEVGKLHDDYIRLLRDHTENRAQLRDRISGIEAYLSRSPLSRLFHRFKKKEGK